MNAKSIGQWLYNHVWQAWEWTIAGILLGAAIESIDLFTGEISKVHPGLAPTLAALSTIVGGILRTQRAKALAKAAEEVQAAQAPPPAPPAAAGFVDVELLIMAVLVFGFALVALLLLTMPKVGRADTPAANPLVLQLDQDWALRPNVTVGPLTGYRWTLGPGNPGAWVANVSIGGLYVLDWREKICFGLGGALDVGAPSRTAPTLEADAMVGGPTIFLPSTTTGLRPALVAQFTTAGGLKQAGIYGTLSLQF